MEVLHEDNHLLVVYKPAGLLSQEDSSGDACLIDLARRWLIERHDKPGNAFVGSVHRLDRPVAGVMVLAKTSKAASRLAAQFREGTVEKQYRAVVHGRPDPPHGQLVHKLKRSWSPEHGTRVKVDARGKRSELLFETVKTRKRRSLLQIKLVTGRSHQIRAQFAAVGTPIIGDTKYGSRQSLSEQAIALYACRLTLTHPTRRGADKLGAMLFAALMDGYRRARMEAQ